MAEKNLNRIAKIKLSGRLDSIIKQYSNDRGTYLCKVQSDEKFKRTK